jgi:hypothetical protein
LVNRPAIKEGYYYNISCHGKLPRLHSYPEPALYLLFIPEQPTDEYEFFFLKQLANE